MACSCIAVDELMQKAVFLLKKKNQRIKWLKRDIEGYEYRSEFDYKYFTMHYRDNKRAFKELKKEKKIIEIKLKNQQKKNSTLEAENLQMWERIRSLEKKIGIYAPGIKDPAHEAERGE